MCISISLSICVCIVYTYILYIVIYIYICIQRYNVIIHVTSCCQCFMIFERISWDLIRSRSAQFPSSPPGVPSEWCRSSLNFQHLQSSPRKFRYFAGNSEISEWISYRVSSHRNFIDYCRFFPCYQGTHRGYLLQLDDLRISSPPTWPVQQPSARDSALFL